MTWQSKNLRGQHIRMGMLIVVIMVLRQTDMPMESNAHLSLTYQTGKDVKRQIDASSLPGFDWDLTGIAAIDRLNVWVVGNVRSPQENVLNAGKGIALASSDGGKSWAIRHVEPGKYFSRVHFVDSLTGWVFDASDLILKTTDAGLTWATQTAPAQSLWCSVQFVDSRRGGVSGADGEVLTTDDGGREWKLTRIATTSDLRHLGFADANNGWIVGARGAAYETNDSGTHWRARGDELSGLLTHWRDSEIAFRMVKFVDSNVGFIAADVLSRRGTFNAQAIVYKTVNRGRSWTTSIVPDALGIRSAEFLTDKEAWIIPGNRANTIVRHTADGGANWSSLPLPPNCEPGRMLFVDSKHGWLLNTSDTFSSDKVFRTTDGGHTWMQLKLAERIVSN